MIQQSLKSILIMLRYAKGGTILSLLKLGVTAILTPLSIYFTQQVIDSVGPFINNEVDVSVIARWTGLLLLSQFFSASNGFLDGILFVGIKRNLNQRLTPAIVNKFKKLDYACFENKGVHDTIRRMGAAPQDKIHNIFNNTIGTITIGLSIIGIAVVFSQVSWWFSVGFLAVLVPILWLDFKSMDTMNTMFNNQSIEERKCDYLGSLLSHKASLFELRIFSAADYIVGKWKDKTEIVLNERLRTTLRTRKYYGISTLVLISWASLIIFSLVNAVQSGQITIGIFIALIGSIASILSMTETLSHSFSNLSQRYLEIKHFDTFMALPEIANNDDCTRIVNPSIEFENVTFTYPGTDVQVLKGVSFKINPNERVALVGENGAGKSTIIKLLCRLYRPDSGRINVNGMNINDLSSKQIRQVFSIVYQDFANYSLTLRENIAFGDIAKLHDDSALRDAMHQGLANGIETLSTKGLDMNLGKLENDGIDLSGGQWQRVAIARACVADSAFVILDEPTASLDPVAESTMYSAFAAVLKNKGSIMISHRLASAKMADKIIVLDNGVVTEQGSHAELIASGGLYKRMFTAQSSWYKGGGKIA